MGNEQSINDNIEIKEMCKNETYNVSIVGKMNSGKSSLLNVFLQSRSLLPVKAMRETSTVVKIKHHDKMNPQLIIDYDNGEQKCIIDNGHDEINKVLKTINKDARDKPLNINLTLMTKLIHDDNINYSNITLYDTPGLSEKMDHKTFEIINISNVVLFLMDISSISDRDNIKYYKQISKIVSEDKYKKIYIILTHIDNDDEDRTLLDWKREVVTDFITNGNTIIDIDNVIPISIKIYNDTNDLILSNINELIIKLGDIITQSKSNFVEQYLLKFLAQIQFNNNKIPNNLIKNPDIILPHSIKQKYKEYSKKNTTIAAITGTLGGCALAGGIALSIIAPPLAAIAIASVVAETSMLVGAGALLTTSIITGHNSNDVKKMLQEEEIFDFDEYEYNDILYDDNNIKLYEGQFKGGRYHGIGTLFYPNGKKCIEGLFENGFLVGASNIYNELGRDIFIGTYSSLTTPKSKTIKINGNWLKYEFENITYIDIKINKEIDMSYKYSDIKFSPSPKRSIIPRMDPFNQIPTEWKINSGDIITVKNYYYDDWYRICVGKHRGYIKIIKRTSLNENKNEYTMDMSIN